MLDSAWLLYYGMDTGPAVWSILYATNFGTGFRNGSKWNAHLAEQYAPHSDFYIGFASDRGIRYHGLPDESDASFFLCNELIPGYLHGMTGVYTTPSGYFVNETASTEFDLSSPHLERQILSGQLEY